MNTFLFTTQILCYGVGFVSASLNIASFVGRRRAKLRRLRDSAITITGRRPRALTAELE